MSDLGLGFCGSIPDHFFKSISGQTLCERSVLGVEVLLSGKFEV